jgi:RimJ/RimL family protein N-acetyltransferase
MAIIKPHYHTLSIGELIIEAARIEDAEELIELVKRLDSETDFLMRDSGEFNIDIKNEEKLITSKRNSDSELLLVARVNKIIVGTLRFSSNRYNRYKHKGQFVISIAKDYWGHRIGSLLMESMINWADAYGFIKIKLEVDSNNERAIRLYKKMGFEQEGVLKMDKYIGNNTYIDSILMSRINLNTKKI